MLTIFVSHFSLCFHIFFLLLSSKAAPLLILPLLCCHPLTFLLCRSLSSKHLSCFYALSLSPDATFLLQSSFSSFPSHPHYWLAGSPPACSHSAAVPLPSFHCLWDHGTICHATRQVWHLRFLSLLLGWKTHSAEITVSMYFLLPHSFFFKAATMSSKLKKYANLVKSSFSTIYITLRS